MEQMGFILCFLYVNYSLKFPRAILKLFVTTFTSLLSKFFEFYPVLRHLLN